MNYIHQLFLSLNSSEINKNPKEIPKIVFGGITVDNFSDWLLLVERSPEQR